MPRGDLFPEIGPYQTGFLPVGDGHVLYWEQVGNPRGKPILFLHGGPGAGAAAVHRRFFDPQIWRLIVFDQRGAGRSTPLGCIEANTTHHLVEDIDKLLDFLGIGRCILFGGSWGSTLALAYAESRPSRVAGMVLRGIFLGRKLEVDWFLHGIGHFFPEAYQAFTNFLPAAERNDILTAYAKRLNNPDPAVHVPAAKAWSIYEGTCSTLMPNIDTVSAFAEDRTALGLARIEAHYFANNLFLPSAGLLGHLEALRGIPGEIVQGRYDMICPPSSAFELVSGWQDARLTIIPDAGHSALETGIRAALLAAVERVRSLV